MCYVFDRGESFSLQVAEKDIPVYKVGTPDKIPEAILSANRGAQYKFGKPKSFLNFQDSIRISPFGDHITGTGLYSLGTEESAKKYLKELLRFARMYATFSNRIYKGIIPKGAHYIVTGGDYISDILIVHNEVLDWYPEICQEFLDKYGENIKPYVPENILKGKE